MRICSLVPAATEALFAVGLGENVVGVTHECDFPPDAAKRPVVTASLLDTAELTSAEIDRAVAEAAGNGRPLYAIDEDVWAGIEADTVVVQELCDVCAVSTDELDEVVSARTLDVETIGYSPSTLDGVMDAIRELGATLGAGGQADEVVAGMRARLDRVRAALAHVENSPRVFVAEWLEPPYAAGHWVPDMVATAGGTDVAGMSGEPSHRMRWADVASLEPDASPIDRRLRHAHELRRFGNREEPWNLSRRHRSSWLSATENSARYDHRVH